MTTATIVVKGRPYKSAFIYSRTQYGVSVKHKNQSTGKDQLWWWWNDEFEVDN